SSLRRALCTRRSDPRARAQRVPRPGAGERPVRLPVAAPARRALRDTARTSAGPPHDPDVRATQCQTATGVDRPVPKSVIFWTGLYSPAYEAVSKEISILHRRFPGFVYGISSRDLFRVGVRERYLVHYHRPYRLAPALVPLLERWFDLSHVFHNLENPCYLDRLKKRPIVLTGAAGG